MVPDTLSAAPGFPTLSRALCQPPRALRWQRCASCLRSRHSDRGSGHSAQLSARCPSPFDCHLSGVLSGHFSSLCFARKLTAAFSEPLHAPFLTPPSRFWLLFKGVFRTDFFSPTALFCGFWSPSSSALSVILPWVMLVRLCMSVALTILFHGTYG